MSNTKLLTKCRILTQSSDQTSEQFAKALEEACEKIQSEKKVINTPMITAIISDQNGKKEAMIQWLEDSIEPIKPDSILGLVLMLRNRLNEKLGEQYVSGNEQKGYKKCIDHILALYPEVESFLKDTSISIEEFKRLQEIHKDYITKCRLYDETQNYIHQLKQEIYDLKHPNNFIDKVKETGFIDKSNQPISEGVVVKIVKDPILLDSLKKSIGTEDRYQIKDTEDGSEWQIDSVIENLLFNDRVWCTCTKGGKLWILCDKNDFKPEQLTLIQKDEK